MFTNTNTAKVLKKKERAGRIPALSPFIPFYNNTPNYLAALEAFTFLLPTKA